MQGIHYRIERNPLTKPASYRLRFIPQGVVGYDELAARIALKNPGSSAASSLSIRVDDYAALKTLVINEYDGRLVDVLDVRVG